MGALFIPLALLTGLLMGFSDHAVIAGTMGAAVARFMVDVVRDFLEASL
jgi:hypothetical protein